MNERRWTWWMVAAVAIGGAELVLGIGNIVSLLQDDRRSAVSALLACGVATVAATLVFGGLVARQRNWLLGSAAVALGVLPGSFAIALWWFPPAVAIGLLCMVVTGCAINDAQRSRAELRSADPSF